MRTAGRALGGPCPCRVRAGGSGGVPGWGGGGEKLSQETMSITGGPGRGPVTDVASSYDRRCIIL